MPSFKPAGRLVALAGAVVVLAALALAQDKPVSVQRRLSLAEKEAFLLNAKIISQRNLSTGVTNSRQAWLDDGKIKHEAHIQTIDVSKASYQTQRGTELNFRDTYKYNMAAYELAKMLDLDMVPPSVERKVAGQTAAVTWWVDDKMFDEIDRLKKNIQPPNLDNWNKQMYVVRVFDQLISNTDRNLGNLVITKDWQIWMIDHTRAFRTRKTLENPKDLVQCDRKLLANLRELNKEGLAQKLGKYLTAMEIGGLLARRDRIVQFFTDQIATKGEGAVLYDLASARK